MQLQCAHCNETIQSADTYSQAKQACPHCGGAVVRISQEAPTVTNPADERAPLTGASTYVGKEFGDYEIEKEIARGGMGVVFKGRQKSLNRPVALKMILASQLASTADIQRFRNEAEAAARLDHPGIVPIFEVGQVDGQHFFSMGLVEGGSLADLVKAGPLPPRQAAELLRTIAEAVQYAHSRNIIHRDLKPANVLLDAAGQPKVTDFGLAKNVETDTGLTATGQVMGTPSYMPPEQAAGRISEVGPLADVYSLGAVLYCLLTGKPPFHADSVMETLKQVLEQDPVSPRKLRAQVDIELETICLKCLRKEPEKRYASAAELAEELRRYLDGEPVMARPIRRPERTIKWIKRNPVVAGLLLSMSVVLLAGTGFSTFFGIESSINAKRAEKEAAAEKKAREAADLSAESEKKLQLEFRKIAESEKKLQLDYRRIAESEKSLRVEAQETAKKMTELATSESKARSAEKQRAGELALQVKETAAALAKAEFVAYAFRLDAARQAIQRGQPTRARELLDLCDPRLLAWEHGFVLRQTAAKLPLDLPGHTHFVQSVAVSPDGKRIVSGSGWLRNPGEVIIWDAATGRGVFTVKGPPPPGRPNDPYGSVECVAFSPDGKKIATGCHEPDHLVGLIDATTGKRIKGFSGHTAGVNSVAFNHDGTRIVSGSSDKTIKVWNVTTGQLERTFKMQANGVYCVAFSPDGKRVAGGIPGSSPRGSPGKGVKVWDTDTGQELLAITEGGYRFAFSPDGKRIATSTFEKNAVKVWDAATGQLVLTLNGHLDMVYSVAYSSDGKRIVSAGQDETIRVWDAATGLEVLTLRGHKAPVMSVAFSPDGTRIVSGSRDRKVKVWDAGPPQEAITLEAPDKVYHVAFSPDGTRIASGGYPAHASKGFDHSVIVWDAATYKPVLNLKEQRFSNVLVLGLAFSPDGKRLVIRGSDGNIKLWDAISGQPVRTLDERGLDIAFSPDGKLIATASIDKTVKLWSTTTDQAAGALSGHTDKIISVAFSPDGKRLASASADRTIKLWDPVTREIVRTFEGHAGPVHRATFSPDGKRLVSVSADRTIKVWETATGRLICTLNVDALHVAFSPDSQRIVSGGNDPVVRIWDAATGQEIMSLKGHTDFVTCVTFSPDGKRIITSSRDNTVKLWDPITGQLAITLAGHSGPVASVAISPDGKRIISASYDGTLKVWDATMR